MDKPMTLKNMGQDIRFGLVYALLLALSLSLLHATSQTAVIWPVGGFLLGYLVITSPHRWVRCLVIASAITLPFEILGLGRPIPLVLTFLVANILEAVLGAVGMRRYCGGAQGFQTVGQVVSFFIGVAVLPWLTAIPAAMAMAWIYPDITWLTVYQAWASSVSLGFVVMPPGVVAYHKDGGRILGRRSLRYAELGLLLALAVGLAWVQFKGGEAGLGTAETHPALLISHPYTIMPLLMWAGVRFNLLGVSGVGLVWVASAILRLTLAAPWPAVELQGNILPFQGLVVAVVLPALCFTVVYWQSQGALRQRLQADAMAAQSQRLAQAAETRFRNMFENLEMALLLEDVSGIYQNLEDLRRQGVTHLGDYLAQHPEHVTDWLSQVQVLEMNHAALRLFQVETREAYLATFASRFSPQALAVFVDSINAMWERRSVFTSEVMYKTATGDDLFAVISFPIPSTVEEASRVPVSLLDLTKRHQAEAQLALQVGRAEALLDLPIAAETLDEADFMQHGQELAEDLTQSQIAFIHFINADQETIELVTWSRRTLDHYCKAAYDRHYPVTQAGIWADALRQKKPVVFNDYATYTHKRGLPEGHARLDRLMTVPVIENSRVVMLAGVGNKASDYTDTDVETVQLIANEIWRLVQRRRALGQLAKSEQQLRAAQRVGNIGSWEMDTATQNLLLSDQALRIFELPLAEVDHSYQEFLAWVHPEDRDKLNQAFQRSLAERQNHSYSYRILTPQGQVKHIYARGETEYSEDGQPLSAFGTVQDVTDQVLASARLQQAAAVFESTLEGVMITDLRGCILDVNQSFETITGYRSTEAVGQTPRILKSGCHDAIFYQTLWQTLVTQGSWRGEILNRRKDGTLYPSLLTITTVHDDQHQPTGYVGVFSDITATKESQERLDYLAHHNSLTGLPNRLLFNDRLHHAINLATRQNTQLALLFIDVDRFKHINDTMGHSAGDDLLRHLAQRFQEAVRTNDTVAHLSGDEFVVLLEDVGPAPNVTLVVQKLFDVLKPPIELQGQEIYVTASMGISLFPADAQEPAILLRNADTAMYQAKEEGRNTYRFYTEAMMAITFEQMLLENALRGALDRQEFHLVYQPQVDLASRQLVGMEVLLRWEHPELGRVSPVQFIPLAEQTGLIRDIGLWVLHSACRQGRKWLDQGYTFGRIAVNIAGPQIRQNGLLAVVQSALEESGLPATCLELEVTEGFIMERAKDSVGQLQALRDLGIQISIDDFGTGYSSLSYLKQLPVEKLKIDRSFIRDIPQDANDMAIAEAVIALGQALNLRVIAEGVETEEQATFLIHKGCHEAQGYLYSRPLPSQAMDAILARQSI
ncbi:MAG: EAL domain-containing protein [Leptolyngbya sp.]|nr:EAL domain-containing protein [Leptolyngbya sp.]